MNKKEYIKKHGKEAYKKKLERDNAAHVRYFNTAKGKAAQQRALIKYTNSKKGKATIERKEKSGKRKSQKTKQHKEWVKTEKGERLAREGERRYKQTTKGKIVQAKVDARRKGLGFLPINEPFEGSQGHHINKDIVLYIPCELHQSIRHNITTGKGTDEINHLAFEWLGERT